ncbi:MAG TPA: extracellular solute-binding protein [Firmicutes bacterium]|nr:extracellular solute-binding protein [Bacillota bacterium]
MDLGEFRDGGQTAKQIYFGGRLESIGAWLHLARTWVFANGGLEVDDVKKPTKLLYDMPQTLDALRFLQKLIVESKVMANSSTTLNNAIGQTNNIAAFTQGKLGMSSGWLSYLPQHTLTNSNVDLVPYPRGPGAGGRYTTDIGPWGLSIYAKSKHPDAAFRLIEFLTGYEGQRVMSGLSGATSVWPFQITWLPENVTNPEIYADLLMAGTLRLVNRERQQLQSIIDSNLNSIWAGNTPVEIAVRQIMEQGPQFLEK